jgi:hypothetical protein
MDQQGGGAMTMGSEEDSIKGDSTTRSSQLQLYPDCVNCITFAADALTGTSLWFAKKSCNAFFGVMLNAKSRRKTPARKRRMREDPFNSFFATMLQI